MGLFSWLDLFIFLQLKEQQGHWHNQPHNPAIDNFNGERHQAMIQLQEHLGQVGTSTDEIEHLMGSPTKILDKPDDMLSYAWSYSYE